MNDLYTKRIIFVALMVLSLISGGLFFATNTLDFVIAAIDQGKLHIPNIAYALARTLSGTLLPLIFIVPPLFAFARVRITKILYIVYGAAMILTTTWIFYFFGEKPFGELFSAEKIINFQTNAFVTSYVFWDTYSLLGTLFTLIFGVLCIFTGIYFDDNRKIVRTFTLLLFAVQVVFPLIADLIESGTVWSSFWLANNYLNLISCIAYTAAIWFGTVNDAVWINLAWEEEFVDSDEDENAPY